MRLGATVVAVLPLAFAAQERAFAREHNFDCFLTAAARFERFWSLGDYNRFLDAAGGREPPPPEGDPLGFRHVFFVIVAHRARAANAVRMERAWLHAAGGRIFLVDDLIDGLPFGSQVVINDGSEGGVPGRAKDAVAISRLMIWLRQAYAGQELGNVNPGTRWVVLLGDDAFVNLARLYYFLSEFPATRHPVAFTHVLSNADVYDFDMPCLYGGALVLNRAAINRMSETASCKECPYVGSNSISLGFCAVFNAVPLVHVPSFHCHLASTGDLDALLIEDPVAHHWVATGGLAASVMAQEVAKLPEGTALHHHPFDADFPKRDCALPAGTRWTAQVLFEKVAVCEEELRGGGASANVQPAGRSQEFLSDGDELGPENAPAYFESRWPGGSSETEAIHEVLYEGGSPWRIAYEALALSLVRKTAGAAKWIFLKSQDVWLHRAEAGRNLRRLLDSGLFALLGTDALLTAFAFVLPGTDRMLDLRPGLLLGTAAARALLGVGAGALLSAATLEELGITVVHQPLLIPDVGALPRGLRGTPSEGALSGVWSVGEVRSHDMVDDLETKAHSRRVFAGMLLENFEDLKRSQGGFEVGRCGPAGLAPLEEARSWLRYLHDDDEHIKVVRGFKGGRREFRTHHAMYRSEAMEVFPVHGTNSETVLVARDCPRGGGV